MKIMLMGVMILINDDGPSIELKIYTTEEDDDDDDDYNKIFDEIKSVHNECYKYIANCNSNGGIDNDSDRKSDSEREHSDCTHDTMTLKMQAKELPKTKRKSDTEIW